jgi:hypothetical protein
VTTSTDLTKAGTAPGLDSGGPQPEPNGLQDGKVASRVPASLMPTITGVRILPGDVVATLVNISTSGMLVDCRDRLKPGSPVTVLIAGAFSPGAVLSRVVRATVSGIGPDGALRYHIGIAFVSPIDLPDPVEPDRETPPLQAATPVSPATPQTEVLRNRW